MRRKRKNITKIVFPISAMIDCTFLLLIYFMTACTMHKQEADISFALPGVAQLDAPINMPDEQIIEIDGSGHVSLNDLELDSVDNKQLPELTIKLRRFKEICLAAKIETLLIIDAADDCPHQRVIEVLNVCAKAQIYNVTFNFDEEPCL